MLTAQVPGGLDPLWRSIFIRVNLSDVRVIMMIMHVPVEELLCQVVMGMYFSARVPVVRSVWALVATFCHDIY
jgi:hypothetical protein